MTVRTRFAPSPTGELHPGNARIAVLNWLFARHSGGRFILRIEDTDVDRNVPGSEEEIFSSLRRLGLDWDEGPNVGGDYGPYRQSERTAIYDEFAQRLVAAGAAYPCYCTPDELEARKQAALNEGGSVGYDGRCRDLSAAQQEELRRQGRAASLRFRVGDGEVIVQDAVRGEIRFEGSEFSDFVIMKSDGQPTYNFGVVVDDAAMAVSHVIRGVGHLANTPRQLMVYAALGVEPPLFLHVPHVLSPDGSPLSKRHGARSLRDYLDEGYHPDALVNYLSLLSWSSPSGDEVLPPQRLIDEIDLDRVGVSDVRLDPEKLDWLSGEYIRRMGLDELAARLAEQLGDESFPDRGGDRLRIARALQERITTFQDARRFLPQFYPPDPMAWDREALECLGDADAAPLLAAVRGRLPNDADWSGESALAAVRAAGAALGVKGKALFMPVRAALTGSTRGPELADVFEVQGAATIRRVLDQAIERSRGD